MYEIQALGQLCEVNMKANAPDWPWSHFFLHSWQQASAQHSAIYISSLSGNFQYSTELTYNLNNTQIRYN